jgi:hypothetical protein
MTQLHKYSTGAYQDIKAKLTELVLVTKDCGLPRSLNDTIEAHRDISEILTKLATYQETLGSRKRALGIQIKNLKTIVPTNGPKQSLKQELAELRMEIAQLKNDNSIVKTKVEQELQDQN